MRITVSLSMSTARRASTRVSSSPAAACSACASSPAFFSASLARASASSLSAMTSSRAACASSSFFSICASSALNWSLQLLARDVSVLSASCTASAAMPSLSELLSSELWVQGVGSTSSLTVSTSVGSTPSAAVLPSLKIHNNSSFAVSSSDLKSIFFPVNKPPPATRSSCSYPERRSRSTSTSSRAADRATRESTKSSDVVPCSFWIILSSRTRLDRSADCALADPSSSSTLTRVVISACNSVSASTTLSLAVCMDTRHSAARCFAGPTSARAAAALRCASLICACKVSISTVIPAIERT
mmetsp:Transcript_7475/g.18551  ORF Transcript_7475/g.18551 Transcript_7475/m.18551 type:complete len:301 (-) Transcript_7475:1332-2234(-)